MKQKVDGRALKAVLAGGFGIAMPGSAWAHGGSDLEAGAAWAAWNLTFAVSGPLVLVAIIYLRGAIRRSSAHTLVLSPRHVAFLTGLFVIFLSLQSPIDPMGERLFVMHQVQHLLLRMVGPMLIMLSRPAAIMTPGLPRVFRVRILVPAASSGIVGFAYRQLRRQWVATVLFVMSLYVWQVPKIHNAAIVNDLIHWAMHLTMLAAGILFFAVIFTTRDRPDEPTHPLRIVILFVTIISNILLGALTTFKTSVLYTAYDIEGWLFGISPLADETGGGIVLWVPGSMMAIIALLIVVYDWNRAEVKRTARGLDRIGAKRKTSAVMPGTGTASDRSDRNRSVGLLLAIVVPIVFALILGIGFFVVVFV